MAGLCSAPRNPPRQMPTALGPGTPTGATTPSSWVSKGGGGRGGWGGRVTILHDSHKHTYMRLLFSHTLSTPRHTAQTTGKEWYLNRLKDVALNGEKAWTQNNMFEFNVVSGCRVFSAISFFFPPTTTFFYARINSFFLSPITHTHTPVAQMLEWLAWRPPAKVCVSWKGIFTHYEVDQ